MTPNATHLRPRTARPDRRCRRWPARVAGVIAAALLAACGGGGGSSTSRHGIAGTCTSGGAPRAGVTIALGGAATAATVTDGAGAYRFDGLGDGSYTVTPSLEGHELAPAQRTIELRGADRAGQDFVATPFPPLVWDEAGWDHVNWQ